jgi:hypothetical protein
MREETKKRGDRKTRRPEKIAEKLLHLGKSNRTGRTYAGAGLTALTKIGLFSKGFTVLHHKNAYRTVIYALLTPLAF